MFLCAGVVFAQPVTVEEETVSTKVKTLDLGSAVDIIPVLKQGVIYSIDDQEFKYAATTEIVEWQGLSLEGGYALPDSLIGVLSYRLGGLERFGVNVPILNLVDVNVGYYIGLKDFNDSEERKFDHGLAATLLNIKF